MIPVKIQCGCGRQYAFNVEPVNGRMSSTVACPVCGLDGTAAANDFVARLLASQPAVTSLGGSMISPTGSAIGRTSSAFQTAGAASLMPSLPRPQAQRTLVSPSVPPRNLWGIGEVQFNKLGNFVVLGAAFIAALISSGRLHFQISVPLLFVLVSICGLIGGSMHMLGRGPIAAGAFLGLIMGSGGYAAVYWRIQAQQRISAWELVIAFILGTVPGFLLQFGVRKTFQKRARE